MRPLPPATRRGRARRWRVKSASSSPAPRGRRATLVLSGALAATFLVGSAGLAFAYWSGPSTGTVSERVDDTRPVTITPGIALAELAPGASGTVTVRMGNPNPVQVLIPSLEADAGAPAAITVDPASEAAGCEASSVTFTPQDNGGLGWFLPPRIGAADGVRTVQLRDAVQMSADASDACQRASFSVHLQVGG